MGIDGFRFDSQVHGKSEKQYGNAPSDLCPCGRDMSDHTLRQKRECNTEAGQ
jgi:hypothetical protein